MNYSIAFVIAMMVSGFINLVHGQKVALQVAFNNGQGLPCGETCCGYSEWRYIFDKIYRGLYRNRQLRGDNDINEEDEVESISNADSDNRELVTYPRRCDSLCKTYPPGRCMGIKCLGYRRELLVNVNDSCENQSVEYQRIVTQLSTDSKLKSNCKALLQAPLLMTCIYSAPC